MSSLMSSISFSERFMAHLYKCNLSKVRMSSISHSSPAALEQLDQLGSRLEKFASSPPPPQPDPKVASSPTPRKTSPGSMIPRPEISPKPAFLSSLAVSAKMSRMTQSMKSPGGGKAKSPPTAAGQATNGVADPKAAVSNAAAKVRTFR